MTTHTIQTTYIEQTADEMTAADRAAIAAARHATTTSHAPYSQFQVGCALTLSDGAIIEGSNQENISYPCGLCAERAALATASATHPEAIVTSLTIVARTANGFTANPITPCGMCRQAIVEVERRQGATIRLNLCSADRVITIPDAQSLLPFAFQEIG